RRRCAGERRLGGGSVGPERLQDRKGRPTMRIFFAILAILVLAALLIVIGWGWHELNRSRQELEQVRQQLHEERRAKAEAENDWMIKEGSTPEAEVTRLKTVDAKMASQIEDRRKAIAAEEVALERLHKSINDDGARLDKHKSDILTLKHDLENNPTFVYVD